MNFVEYRHMNQKTFGRTHKNTAMKNNIGTLDKTLRILFSVVFGVLFLGGFVSGFGAIIGFAVVGQLLLTSMVSYCPVYNFLGINTIRRSETNRDFRNWD